MDYTNDRPSPQGRGARNAADMEHWTQRAHLSQPGMLGLGPDGHLGSACSDEHERRECPGGCGKQNPAVDLKGVVGACDIVEAEAARDGVALAAWRPEVPLDDVRPAWTAQCS